MIRTTAIPNTNFKVLNLSAHWSMSLNVLLGNLVMLIHLAVLVVLVGIPCMQCWSANYVMI